MPKEGREGRGNSETTETQENEGRGRDRQGRTVPKASLSSNSGSRRLGISFSCWQLWRPL